MIEGNSFEPIIDSKNRLVRRMDNPPPQSVPIEYVSNELARRRIVNAVSQITLELIWR
jgi:hypothetical protein